MELDDLAEALGTWSEDDTALYLALAGGLEELIRAGLLEVGTRLPAERRLAARLFVSRGTVVAAYEELRRRGLLRTRQGSGTVVADIDLPDVGATFRAERHADDPGGVFEGFFAGLSSDEVIDFRGAYWVGTDDLPDDVFELPVEAWAATRAGTGYSPAGLPELRAAIAEHFTAGGLPTEPDQVLVTSGSQQGISLITQLLVGEGDVVVTEALTYPGALDVFGLARARVHPVAMEHGSVDLHRLGRAVERVRPRFAYLMPGGHNPTGAVMDDDGKARLAEMASTWNTVLVDDRTLAGLAQDETHPSPVAAMAATDAPILTLGSTSKTFWGGLRIGWVRGPVSLIDRLIRLKAVVDLGTPVASQLLAARMLPMLDDLRRMRRPELLRRRDALTSALRTHLPEWEFEVPDTGLVLWTGLPIRDVRAFLPAASAHGVGLVPGDVSSPSGEHTDHLRLPFGHPPEVTEDAVERLAAAWADYTTRHRSRRARRRVDVIV